MITTEREADAVHRAQFYIGGQWVAPHGRDVFVSVSSTTEEEIGRSSQGTAADVDAAVTAARDALPGWRSLTANERAGYMEALAVSLEKRGEELGALIAQEVGTPIRTAVRANANGPAAYLRYFARLALQLDEPEIRGTGTTLVQRQPVGVAGMIVPWNYPVGLIHFKLAPALGAGCTAVMKPSPETALSSYLFAEAVDEAGLPAGVVNVVPGGRDVGEHLITHGGVDKISFTGSTAAGRRIGELCGRALKPVTLELGGKSAAVLLDDAPLADFLASLGAICMANNGQTCTNNTRIVVPRSQYDEVLAAVTDTVAGYALGDPTDPATQIGPVVSAAARDRIEDYIAGGEAAGARVCVGGHRQSGIDSGFFVAPTVFSHVSPDMDIARQEIFGPVVAVIAYDGGDDGAVELANDSEYGLAGTVWSADPDRGLQVACRIDTGTVGVNSYLMDPSAPFGGHKASGLGYELGPEGLDSYLKLTSIYRTAR
jgi:aldehyde dehydrogenase (NAD+)